MKIVFSGTLQTFYITLNPSQKQELMEAIKKYKEWNGVAIKTKEHLEKDIAQIGADRLYWAYKSDSTGNFSRGFQFTAGFLSQTSQQHEFLLRFPKVTSIRNEYINAAPPSVYFDYAEVLKLEKLISDEAITLAIKKEKDKQQKSAELFK